MPTRIPSVSLPPAAELRRLKLSPEVAWYLLDRGYALPESPPKIKTPEPRKVKGALFDADRVDRVISAFRRLRHSKGQWAGRPLDPDVWQVAYVLAPVFGWVRWSDEADRYVRVISTAYVDVPRKNGKSTMCGGIAIYLTAADGEQGAEVVAAASTRDQAGFVFAPIKVMAQKAPALKGHVTALASKILHPKSGSYFQVISSVADAQHGANLHGGVIDELHVHKTPELVEVIETSTGSRAQPLIAMITTADDGRQDTIYARKRDYIEKLAKGVLKDETTFGVVFAADETDDPFAVETMKKANPGYGISPTAAYLKKAALKAQNSPAEKSSYLRLHLGLRTKQQTKYVDLELWDRNAGLVVLERLKGRAAYGGLDLAATSDLCSLAWLFPDEDWQGFDVLWRHWLPERAFDKLNDRTAGNAQVWRDEGWLTVTSGDTADYDFILEQMKADQDAFSVKSVGYDRWNASQLVNDLTGEGFDMVKIGQGFISLSAPLKAIKHTLLSGTADTPRFRHGGNPVMRWQTDNLAVATDAAENVKPDKAAAGDKIDGWSAAVDAMAVVLEGKPDKKSAYDDEDSDLMVV